MRKRVCLTFLLVLSLAGVIGAASAPAAPPKASPSTAGAAAAHVVLPAWLTSPDSALPPSAGFLPPFELRTCQSQCLANYRQCKAACNGDSLCLQNCSDTLGCCQGFCIGGGCP
ncbi:MAG TPA: hypothetical protein VMM92_11685 [Thermoanaerobaculia bacterium]|nr:hypothetical protein [Thermoanaerobaculia bacterium]